MDPQVHRLVGITSGLGNAREGQPFHDVTVTVDCTDSAFYVAVVEAWGTTGEAQDAVDGTRTAATAAGRTVSDALFSARRFARDAGIHAGFADDALDAAYAAILDARHRARKGA